MEEDTLTEQPRKRTPRAAALEHAPYLPPKAENADIGAIKALMRGDAPPDVQQRALAFIINTLCGTYDLSFRPGADGERETAFAEGRRFVGLQLVKYTKQKLTIEEQEHG